MDDDEDFVRPPSRNPSYDSEGDRYSDIGRPPQLTRVTRDVPPRWQVPMKAGSYDEDSDDDDDFRPTLRRQPSYNQNRRGRYHYHERGSFPSPYDNHQAMVEQTLSRSHGFQEYPPPPVRRKSSRGPDSIQYGSLARRPSLQRNSSSRSVHRDGFDRRPSLQRHPSARSMNHDGLARRPSLQRHPSSRSVRNNDGDILSHQPSLGIHDHPHQPQRKKSVNATKRQARRTSSMPMGSSSRDLSYIDNTQPRPQRRQSMQIKNVKSNDMLAKRSKSIHRGFHKHQSMSEEEIDDIWVECIVLGGEGGPRKCFKSLNTNRKPRTEPPTGAKTVVYLEDMILRKKEEEVPEKPVSSKEKKKPADKATKSKKQAKPEKKPKRRGSIFGIFKKSGK